jgi:oligoendopeptidase F
MGAQTLFDRRVYASFDVSALWSRATCRRLSIGIADRTFYVYKYATGYSTAVALSEGILKEGEPAVKRYKEFLSMGGSAYPLDELRHAGVDLATPAPVDAALEKFERILDDAEATLAKLQ